MPSKKQYHEIQLPRLTPLGRDSVAGGTVIGDTVSDGVRTLVVKMPVKEANVANKKKAAKKPVQKVQKVEHVQDKAKESPTSFDTSKMIDEQGQQKPGVN